MNDKKKIKFGDSVVSNIVIYFLAFFLAIPFAVVLYDNLSFLSINNIHLKFSIGFLFGYLLAIYMLRSLKPLVFAIFIIAFISLSVNQLRQNGYDYSNLTYDYKSIVFSLWSNSKNLSSTYIDQSIDEIADELISSIDYETPEVRNFAVEAATKYFNEGSLYRRHHDLVRYLSLFKTINSQWKYVKDPSDKEYFAAPNESIKLMAGDCDDHTILMSAAIKAIGGRARMVWIEGHIYPEVNLGPEEDFDRNVAFLISQLFQDEYNGKGFHGHIDDNGDVWLNFDYTASFPGGKILNNKIIRILEI